MPLGRTELGARVVINVNSSKFLGFLKSQKGHFNVMLSGKVLTDILAGVSQKTLSNVYGHFPQKPSFSNIFYCYYIIDCIFMTYNVICLSFIFSITVWTTPSEYMMLLASVS